MILIVIAGCGQKPLFEENFGPGSDKNWVISDPADVKFENNRFVINPGSKDKPTLTKTSFSGDYAIEVDTIIVSGNRVHFIVRGVDFENYARIWANEERVIYQNRNQGSFGPEVGIKPIKLEKGRKYHWRIEIKGENYTVHIDNQLLGTISDKGFVGGAAYKVGMESHSSEVIFENLKVHQLK